MIKNSLISYIISLRIRLLIRREMVARLPASMRYSKFNSIVEWKNWNPSYKDNIKKKYEILNF